MNKAQLKRYLNNVRDVHACLRRYAVKNRPVVYDVVFIPRSVIASMSGDDMAVHKFVVAHCRRKRAIRKRMHVYSYSISLNKDGRVYAKIGWPYVNMFHGTSSTAYMD